MKKYCVIGYPVKHSLSPRLFNAAFKKLRIDARYGFAEVKPKDLDKFMRGFSENFAGANVTIPHKQAVIQYLDKLSPEAQKIGAVNVILNKNGKLFGYNTDVFGAMAAVKTEIKSLRGKNVIVLGAGGAARAVVYGLKKAGAKVLILNRTIEHAKKLACDFKCKFGELKDFSAKECDLLINTTSVGMKRKGASFGRINCLAEPRLGLEKGDYKAESPLPNLRAILKNATKNPVVMDIIYTPHMTKFLRDAKSAGCKIITGDKMFLAQAAASFKIWMGSRLICARAQIAV